MNIFDRLYSRLIREIFRIFNYSYLNKYELLLKNKKTFNTNILNVNNYLNSHIYNISADENSLGNETLVIHIPYGGLGDHLLYSHIPRIAKQSGIYKRVFLSKKSVLRNPNHLKYIWDKNPYFDGLSELENLHDYNSRQISNFDETKGNILDQIMLSYGLDDKTRWHEPELYFEVPIFPELKGKTVYDPNFISYSGGLSSLKIEKYFKKQNFEINFQFTARSNFALPVISFDESIQDSSFEEFCGIIVSCEKIISLTTGTATLAAALRKSAFVIYGNNIQSYFLHSKNHNYIKI
jgi:hypothetical protein